MSLQNLEQTISRVFTRADVLSKTLSPAPRNPLPMAITGPHGFRPGGQNVALAKEQYEHHRGRVYSAIRVVTQRIANQPVFVARVNPTPSIRSLKGLVDAGDFDVKNLSKDINPNRLELIEDHPLCDLIDHPNDLMVRSVLWTNTVTNLLVTGRSLWVLSEDGDGNPQIIPIPTTWAKPVHQGGKKFVAWEVKPPSSPDDPMIVPRDRMAHFYFPDPSDPFKALSPLQMQARGILSDEAISEAQQIAFRNGIFPNMAVVVGDVETADGPAQVELQPGQRISLIKWIQQQFVGMRNYGHPIILDALIKDIKRISEKPNEMDFLDSSGLTKTIIYEGFGVNPISAGQVEGANRASSAVADEHLLTNTVNPIINLLSQGMTKWLSPLFATDNERLKIWIAPAEPRDAEMNIKKWDIARQTFSVTRNDVRTKLMGLPPLDGFDDVIVPLAMVSNK